TQRLREAEAEKVPPIFRFVPSMPEQAEDSLRNSFAARRAELVRALEAEFGHPVPLLTVEFTHARFGQRVSAFRRVRPTFPLEPRLAELWAYGDSGDAVLEAWKRDLDLLTNGYVRADVLPAGELLTAPYVRLI